MSLITTAIYNKLVNDSVLTSLLSTYEGSPAIFTMDPAPGDAVLPYIVTAGDVAQSPWDTKITRGRDIIRDIRCYAEADGSPVVIEAIAERVRDLLHRSSLTISGYNWILSLATGPTVADEEDVYGRIITVTEKVQKI